MRRQQGWLEKAAAGLRAVQGGGAPDFPLGRIGSFQKMTLPTGQPDPPRPKRVRPGPGGSWPRTAEKQSGHPAAAKMAILVLHRLVRFVGFWTALHAQ